MLQGHPRPWPFAKLRTLWVPAHKVQGTKTDNAVLTFYLAFSLGGSVPISVVQIGLCNLKNVQIYIFPANQATDEKLPGGLSQRQGPGSP